jgi:hypothetical protein
MTVVHPDGLPELFLERSLVERTAVLDHRVRAFCLSSGNLRAAEMAQRFIDMLDQITEACSQPGPFLYTVSASAFAGCDSTAEWSGSEPGHSVAREQGSVNTPCSSLRLTRALLAA